MRGITFDTGALICLVDQRRLNLRKIVDTALSNGIPITVPAAVVAEWWRTGKLEKERAACLRAMFVEPLTDAVARLAGAALTATRGARSIDAIVMASASVRGDVLYTSDPRDLLALRASMPQFARVQILQT